MTMLTTFRAQAFFLLLSGLSISACAPPSAPLSHERNTDAVLRIAGDTVLVNAGAASNGQAIHPGDLVTTKPQSAALIKFSDGTNVQLDENTDLLLNRWTEGRLAISVRAGLIEVVTGSQMEAVNVDTEAASFHAHSRFTVEVRPDRSILTDLYSGRISLTRPQSEHVVMPGEYLLVTLDGHFEFGTTPPARVRERRQRFHRWNFFAVSGLFAGISTKTRGIMIGGHIGRREIRASRMFVGPHTFPPEDFAAYGILAFTAGATTSDLTRYVMICESFMQTIVASSELELPVADQMVTVWPVDEEVDVEELNRESDTLAACDTAIDKYHLPTALRAIRDAEAAGARLIGRGPFLLAWAPSEDKGKDDTLVLVSNLSDVTLTAQAKEIFRFWREDIEKDPSLWNKGFQAEKLRLKVRMWFDRYGTELMNFFGAG